MLLPPPPGRLSRGVSGEWRRSGLFPELISENHHRCPQLMSRRLKNQPGLRVCWGRAAAVERKMPFLCIFIF